MNKLLENLALDYSHPWTDSEDSADRDYREGRLTEIRGAVVKLATLHADLARSRAECREAVEALDKIVKAQPCLDQGACFYPQHGPEGEDLGEQYVDPLSIIQEMAAIAAAVLNRVKEN